jgi:DNA-binding protein YbaB
MERKSSLMYKMNVGVHFGLVVFAILCTAAQSWIETRSFPRSGSASSSFGSSFGSLRIHPKDSVRGSFPFPHVQAGRAGATSRLFAFLWFGGSDDEKQNNDSDDKVASSRANNNLGGVANIMDSMGSFKTSQRVGERTNAVLQDLSNVLVEGSAADGKVKITYNGQQVPMGVQIEDTYFQSLKGRGKDGAEELGIALTQAMQEAHSKSAAKMEEKLKSLYSDLGLES